MSLRDQYNQKNIVQEQKNLIDHILQTYKATNEYAISKVEQRNIILVGRTRTGKSTIKSLLLDPTRIPEELTLFSHTETPTLDSYYVADKNFVLNIMDTPGLGERGNDELEARDNAKIVKDIDAFINHEFTKLHIICFCIAVTCGINDQDVQIIRQLLDIFDESASKNSCLIITHCESKNKEERNKLKRELMQDKYFKEVFGYCKLGVLFSGALDPDDYNMANETLTDQFFTINTDRAELIQLFTGDIEPVSLELTQISELRRARDDAKLKETKLHLIQGDLDMRISEQMRIENELGMTTAKLEKIRSYINKVEHTNTELAAQFKEKTKYQEDLQRSLAKEHMYLEECEKHLEAQQQACNRITEQLNDQQQASSSIKRNLDNVQEGLLRIENGYRAENIHLRALQAKLYEQLADASKKIQDQYQLLENNQLERKEAQNPQKEKKSRFFGSK